MTYWILNLVFLAITAVLLVVFRKNFPKSAWLSTLLIMLSLTAIFDNLIIGTGIVAYDQDKISGLKILLAPIEDFAYTVTAALLLPTLWNYLRGRSARR